MTGTYHANIYSSNTLALVKNRLRDHHFPTTETQKIIESDRTNTYTGGTDDWFGIAVSISGDYAIVGSPYGDEDASNGNTLTSAGAAYIFKHNGTSWVEQQKIVPNVRESGFRFGWSVSISGDYVIVGTASTDGADAGEAYIFKRSATTSTWTQEYKLVASDASGDDQFGNSVSISGDYAIVGASYEDLSGSDGAGAAYIFKRSGVTWTEETKVVASDRAGGDKFGKSVSISGDYAIVGSHNEDHDVTGGNVLSNAGSAYIFKRSAATSTWTQETKIVASDRAVGDQFGWSVSISGDYAIVGSVYEDHDVTGGNVLSNAGSAYVFKRSGTTWTQETKIVASDRAGSDYFGASVSISGDYAIVGAHYEDHDFSGANYMSAAGSAYIFKRSGTTWTQTSKISASDRGGSDYFGYSVSISGNRSIVGAYGHDYDLNGANFVSQTGACYLFERPAIGPDTTITHEPTFTSASAVSTGESGWAVSASSQYNSSYVPWYAFNDGTGSWHSAEPDGGPHWLKIQLPTKKVLSGYDLKARDDSASLIRAPKTWVLEGSNDDSTWTELEPYHTNDESWTGGSTPPARQFSISTTTAYKYYRVYITLATDDNEAVAIGEFTLNIKPPASPALNFDGYNKLTAPVLDASFTAERLSDWDSSNSGKTVVANSGDWPETTAGITEYNVLQNGDKSYQKTSGGSSRDSAQLFDTISSGWANASHGASGTHSPMTWGYKFTTGAKKVGKMILTQPPNTHPAGNVTIKYWDGSAMVTVSNQSPTGMTSEVDLSSTEFTFDIVSAQYWQIDCYRHSTHNGTTYTGLSEWQLYSGRDPVTTVLTKGSDSWDVGTASNVYIDAAGTYDAQAKNSNTFVIKTSNVVSAPVTPKFEWKADGTETQILLASDRDTNTQLGYDAAIDGDYIIGGGPQDDEGGSQAGAAYIFKRTGTTWTQQAKLIVSDAAANDQAGEFVNIFGDYAIIGVYTKSSSAGAAYIFKRDTGAETWTEQEKITASDAAASDKFGNSVSINSDYAIVGSPYNDSPDNSGSAYIFIRSGSSWTQQAKLTASDAASNDEFGLSVDISGDYVISGANSGDQRPGSAYVFKYDATHPPDDLPPVDSVGTGFNYKRYTALDTSTHYVYKMWRNSANDWRTLSPASANTIKVLKTDSTDWSDNDTTDTNPTYIDTTTYSGKVSLGQSGPIENYRFSVPTFGIWNQQAKLQASDGATSDRFGKAVALSGDYAVIGAYADDSPSNSGSAYIFKKESTYVFTGTSPSTITLGGFWYTDFSRWYQKSTSDATSSYVRYILWNSSGQVGANYGTSFYTNSSGDLILDVNDSTGGSSTPFYFVNNTTSTTVSSGTGVVSVGDSIELFTSLNTSEATFTVPSVFAPTSGDVWSQQAKLLPSDAAGSDNFGWKVEISGDIAVIGAYHADPGGVSNAGSAYIFERSGTTWTEIKKLTASTHATTDGRFGEGLGVSGTTVVVGAGYEDVDSVTHAGALHVFDKVYVGPTLTYDNSNKLSLTGVTTPSTNLTVGTNTYDIGSAKVVFIKDQGTYTFHTNDGDQALILSNVVSSTPTGTTYLYNVYSNPSTRVSNYSTANTSKAQVSGNGTWPVSSFMATHNVLNNGDKAYGKTDGGSSRDPAQLFDTISSAWGEASHGTNGTHSPMSWGYEFTSGAKMINKMILYQPPNTHPAGNVTIKYWDGTSMTTVSNQSPTGMTSEVALSSTEFTFDAVSSQYWQIDCYRHATQTTGYTGLSEWEIYSAATSLTLSGTTPSQVYDNTKTITVSNIPSTQTGITSKIYKGATAYTIHATEPTSNVIIKNTGSYVSVFTTSNIAYLTNTVNVNATPTTTSDDNTIEDEALDVTTTTSVSKTIAFHDGLFADSDDPHGDGSITAAAIAGHVYSDTAPGTYTWGTLTSCVRTAMANNLYSDENFGYNNGTPPTAGFTTYKWTPPGTITNGRTLVVAGGGGGGTDMGGGGGAGGLLASTTTNIAHAEQTIQVGSGGARGYGPGNSNDHGGGDGGDSSISGPGITSIGGGGGGTAHTNNGREFGRDGGSGGGTSGYYQNGNHGPRGYGTSGQGNDGGLTTASYYSSGGGGAGEVGVSGGSGVPGDGGDGLEDDILGTSYWWAGGGGANAYNSQGSGHGGKGGGGGGAATHTGHSSNWRVGLGNTNGITNGGDGENPGGNWNTATGGSGGKHTGGGGGGGQHNTGGVTTMRGGRGGSGIVAIKFTAQKTVIVTGIPGSTAVPVETTTDAPSVTLDATDTTVTDPILDLDFTTTLPRNLKRYNSITNSSIGARFNRTESKKKRVQKSINTDTFSIELTANNMGDSSSSTSTLPVTVVNSGAGTQYMSGWTTGTTSEFQVPSDAPNALYYYSQNDDSAGGSISVSSASTTAYTVTVVSSSAGTQYGLGTSWWTVAGTPGSSGATSTFVAPSNAPNTLYYYCGAHSTNMGGAINMVSGPVSSTFDVTVSSYYGSNYYYIDGTQQATISLVRGKTYTFNNNASGSHPMYITTSSDGATYNYPPGGWNDGSSTVTFVVPMDAPSTLYYKCNNHNGMGGTINILGPTASPLEVTVSGGKFVINDDSQATLQLVRGETYVFNQEDDSNETHPIRLSETSNGTHVTGGSGFYIGGTQRPTLTMVRGNTYTFDQTNASNGSHVLQIATASDGTQYTSGYTTGTFVVPLSAPDTLYYKSSTTSGMGGLINVTGSTTSAFVVTFSGGKFSIGGVQQASLSVIRGLTYTFDQTESTNSTHVLLLSSTSDGTRNTGVNKYYISGVETPTLTFIRGNTYTFDQSDDTNTNHPIRLSETSNGEHASGSPSQYTSGWTTTPASTTMFQEFRVRRVSLRFPRTHQVHFTIIVNTIPVWVELDL